MIAARSLNGIIGSGDKIPWKVRDEQRLFKKITMGGTLIMGRKTFVSIGKALPGRDTIVISRNKNFSSDHCKVCPSLQVAFAEAKKLAKSIFVAGGGEIYKLALPFVKTVHISTIETQAQGDIYFPDFPTKDFILIEERKFESTINYIYQRFERRNQITNLYKT
ncbi:MAG: dihydrofolate reductase [Gammaproteobacteria bacterium TMED1]|nr:MAG: dihydrofolate reductase [Gammaproteobacteria bacterium TMED1]|tara:strand:+ start:6315 stop:6806 length:492 start_codon:yes stop_codon:yes gene_type:complete